MAASGDENKPIDVEADRAELDDARGINRFFGNVIITQGSRTVKGDKVVIKGEEGKDQVMIVDGSRKKPAFFQHKNDDGTISTGNSLHMEFYNDSGIVIFTQDAIMRHQGNTLKGEKISYSTKRDVVNALCDNGGRVKLRLKPANKN